MRLWNVVECLSRDFVCVDLGVEREICEVSLWGDYEAAVESLEILGV
jgi:hypothetical protein